jgi:hypothetical protein
VHGQTCSPFSRLIPHRRAFVRRCRGDLIDAGSVPEFRNVSEDRVDLWRLSDVDPPDR